MEQRRITIEASSMNDAVRRVAAELGLPESRLEGKILSEERGFLGLFGKKLQVEVTVKLEETASGLCASNKENLMRDSKKFLADLMRVMEFETKIEETGDCCISIEGADSALILGRYGDNLKAVEYLLNLSLRETKEVPRIRLDSDGYREKRAASLERLAYSAAKKAVERGIPVRLDPMASWERRIVHIALKDSEDVTTESVGESPDRKVVVMPKVNPHENRTHARRKYRR